jgi:hypothetical protein
MVENVEQIEARLAAYIDDELTPDERVELERHLDANPTHRALIRELTGHRDLLRMLPREHAPADLSEPLEGAMERDALLGGGDPLTEYRVVRNRRWWPQLLAAAAIFVLAFGLAAIVFYVLPPKHPTVSLVQPPEPEGSREERVAREKLVQDVPPQVSGNLEVAVADAVEDSSDKSGLAEVATTALFKKSVDAAEPAPSPDTLVITITADNPQQASTDLLSYFSNNGISFSQVPNPETWGNATAVVAGEESGVQLVMQDSAGAQPENAPLARQADRSFVAGVAGGGAMRDTAVATPAPSPSGSSRARRAAVRSEAAALPTTLPSAPQELQQREARTQVVTGTATGTPSPDRYVVLASLNGTQAERLADTFGRASFGRRAELRREAIALPVVATPTQSVPAAPRPVRGIQVGLPSKVADAPHGQGEDFKLLTPATKPVDPTFAWTLSEETLTAAAAPTTRPTEPFAFSLPSVERVLDAQVFNCVVVVRKPEAATAVPATQPATAAPATRPIAP